MKTGNRKKSREKQKSRANQKLRGNFAGRLRILRAGLIAGEKMGEERGKTADGAVL